MHDLFSSEAAPKRASDWKAVVARYQRPEVWRAIWQLTNTLVPYAALWWLIYASLSISLWLTLPLVVLAGGFMVRIFIIFHDCGHGSFFKSRLANDLVGFIAGILSFTPYYHWRWEHAIHHSSSGDLDRRGTGDVWTMTLQEYQQAPLGKKIRYRLARNPFVLFVLGPLYLFLVQHRIPSAKAPPREKWSVYWTNLGILALGAAMSWMFGFKIYLFLQFAVIVIAGTSGVWLFYVQHQFEGVYWARGDDWDYAEAALKGSSFYKLPKILQWFSGSIGYHHIHHLSPRIPNYSLERCHKAEPLFQTVKPITLLTSLKSFRFRLWDEHRRELVGYSALRRSMRAR